uniref:Reverse transcriptase domain-containing protein n=1 Tax=Cannabis sativa TaxID=3483 RepID=A0A803QPN5_CANSA
MASSSHNVPIPHSHDLNQPPLPTSPWSYPQAAPTTTMAAPSYGAPTPTNPSHSMTTAPLPSQGKPKRPDCLDAAEFRKMLKCTCNLAKSLEEGSIEELNRKKQPYHTEERLDWCLSNADWDANFPNPRLLHGDFFGSDHRPLILTLHFQADQPTPTPRFIFSFGFQNQGSRIAFPTNAQLNSSRYLESELNRLLHKEEEYWQQRSRITWLRLGDKNTRYFHLIASMRLQTNKIHSLQCSDGSTANDTPSILSTIEHYFTQLFQSQLPEDDIIDSILSGINERLTEDEVELLQATFSANEIMTAAFQLANDKAPGLDGFNGSFFQNNWHLLGVDVINAAQSFLNGDANIAAINNTLIILIPKKANPEQIVDYRPISLCSTVYKIISRVLVNRLKPILSRIISPSQSAFLPNRLISNNIIIGQEVMYSLSHRKTGRLGWMALKLDMAKAFDRVEWVLVLGHVKPSRGIRQGDPLSPYLFLLCSEGMSSLICHKAQEAQPCKHSLGIKIARRAPTISHLFFADDSLLFSSSSPLAATVIKQILHDYSLASGQLVNFSKSALFFSPNTSVETKTSITTILGIPVRDAIDKYVGLLQTFGRTKKDAFNYIKDQVWSNLNKWNSKLFSKGGKDVLLKSSVQAIPSYAMSCFKLPASFHSKLKSMMARFWWGGMEESRKINWKN